MAQKQAPLDNNACCLTSLTKTTQHSQVTKRHKNVLRYKNMSSDTVEIINLAQRGLIKKKTQQLQPPIPSPSQQCESKSSHKSLKVALESGSIQVRRASTRTVLIYVMKMVS